MSVAGLKTYVALFLPNFFRIFGKGIFWRPGNDKRSLKLANYLFLVVNRQGETVLTLKLMKKHSTVETKTQNENGTYDVKRQQPSLPNIIPMVHHSFKEIVEIRTKSLGFPYAFLL